EHAELVPVRVPQPRGLVVASADETSVRRVLQRDDRLRVTVDDLALLSARYVPKTDREALDAPRQRPSVGAEGDAPDDALVAAKRPQQRAALHVPDAHERIVASAREELPVRAESDRPDRRPLNVGPLQQAILTT